MKKFFKEFKTFITRGNVIDLAVGVIVGSAFTAIVTALTNQIFKPIVNWALSGADGGLESAVTMLKVVLDDTGAVDMTKSIFIDWGAFLTAILNFIIIALILFVIVKLINGFRNVAKPKFFGFSKREYIDFRKEGKTRNQIEEMGKARDEQAAAEKAAKEAEAKKHSTECLLEQILTLMEERNDLEKAKAEKESSKKGAQVL